MAHELAKSQIYAHSLSRFLLIFLFVFGPTVAIIAQQTLTSHSRKARQAYLEAEKLYAAGKSASALEFLDKAIQADSQFVEAYLLQGELFTNEKKLSLALGSYEKAISVDSAFFPPVFVLMGELQYRLGDFARAQKSFAVARRFVPEGGKTAQQAFVWGKNALQADSLLLHPSAKPIWFDFAEVNSAGNEYINGLQIDGRSLLFTRRATRVSDKTGLFDEKLYMAVVADSAVSAIVPVDIPGVMGNLGAATLSADGRQIWFSGCGWPQAQGSCDLYHVNHEKGRWSQPHSLGNNINTGAWESQPALTPDGRELYFASSRKGGYGGSDLYKSVKLPDGSWSKPINLGSDVNTEKDEMTPFIHPDGKTLYFSSEGHWPQLGESDIYVCRLDEAGRWSKPVNIGHPINSIANELGIVVTADGTMALVSSDRKGEQAGFDLFAFRLTEPSAKPQTVRYVRIVVKDRKTDEPLTASYKVSDLADGTLIFNDFCDAEGRFLLPLMPDKTYGLQLVMPGYLLFSEHFVADTANDEPSNERSVWLDPIAPGEKMVLKNVFFETGKAELQPSSYPELQNIAAFLHENPKVSIRLSGHTDNTGVASANLKLSLQRAEVVKEYIVNQHILPDRVETCGYGAEKPIADNQTEEGRRLNRRTEMEIR